MTQSPIGGPATPTKTTNDGSRVKGGPAIRAFVVTDGRSVEGGPSQPIYRVSDAEIAAGQFVVEGNRPIPISEQGEASGDLAQPVYIVDANSPSDDPLPIITSPKFSSAEIGAVDASTLVVTFDQAVTANENDYGSGVTVKVNDVSAYISGGIRQTNHAVVYYGLTDPVSFGDTVTWEYSASSGLIVSEVGGVALQNVSAQSVTNNVAPSDPIGDALRADAVAYWKMDESSGTRADATTKGSNLSEGIETLSAVGKINQAAQFVRSNGTYLQCSSNANLKMGDIDFTVALWVYIDSYGSGNDRYILTKGLTGDEYWVLFSPTVSSSIFFGFVDGDFNYLEVGKLTADPLNLGEWYFVVGYHDSNSSNICFLLNNSGLNSLHVTPGGISTDDPFTVGAYGDGALNFDGRVDEVGIWKRLLTSDEMDYLYNSGAGRALFP